MDLKKPKRFCEIKSNSGLPDTAMVIGAVWSAFSKSVEQVPEERKLIAYNGKYALKLLL